MMIQIDGTTLGWALEYIEWVPDDRHNADHIDREALITAIKYAFARDYDQGDKHDNN
jgi:hypothetical protein